MPQKIFIGDEAVLHIDFSLDAGDRAFPADSLGDLPIASWDDDTDNEPDSVDSPNSIEQNSIEQYTVTRIFLQKNETQNRNDYSLEITFFPWTTGEILIAPIDCGAFVFAPEPLSVASRLEALGGEIEMRPPKPPLLVPGTTYIIIGFVLFFMLFVLAASALVLQFLKKPLYYRRFLRDVKKAEKAQKSQENVMRYIDNRVDMNIDKSFRKFLSAHFKENFDSHSTSELYDFLLARKEDGTESESKIEKQLEIAQTAKTFFSLCDAVRYGKRKLGADDALHLTEQASFCADELVLLKMAAK
ncbi:MAG: hypothetical protein Ta2A_22290 [Treponemataceae bacterium]|nr:MAG: hypothetical protein Ta2A_22290 [Treponemataceae bacterium]